MPTWRCLATDQSGLGSFFMQQYARNTTKRMRARDSTSNTTHITVEFCRIISLGRSKKGVERGSSEPFFFMPTKRSRVGTNTIQQKAITLNIGGEYNAARTSF